MLFSKDVLAACLVLFFVYSKIYVEVQETSPEELVYFNGRYCISAIAVLFRCWFSSN